MRWRQCWLLGWFLFTACDSRTPAPPPEQPGVEAPSDSAVILVTQLAARHNQHRAGLGLTPLQADSQLTAAAQQHAANMAAQRQLSHTLDGEGPGQRIASAGYRARGWGENIAYTMHSGAVTDSTADVFHNWLRSSGHKRNIENAKWREIGIGHAVSGSRHYWCVVFAYD